MQINWEKVGRKFFPTFSSEVIIIISGQVNEEGLVLGGLIVRDDEELNCLVD